MSLKEVKQCRGESYVCIRLYVKKEKSLIKKKERLRGKHDETLRETADDG